jgi:SagB-type dehydrogenase family enzyme
MARRTLLYRRSQHLVCYWSERRLVYHNYATGDRTHASPLLARILQAFSDWQPAEALGSAVPAAEQSTRRALVRRLVDRSLLERSDRTTPSREQCLGDWQDWNPAAGFFHFSTKDVLNRTSLEVSERELRAKARVTPMPPPIKAYPRHGVLPLPPPATHGEFPAILLARRTWRQFSRAPISRDHIATLLSLTWGVQRWGRVRGQGRIVLKTSPSGGACHPGEVYLVPLNVRGLERGVYHYASDRHVLERLRVQSRVDRITRYLPMQPWFRGAAALFLMSAVFPREQWRYPVARAYRAVLLDAGHLCQTFCLTATWLGLAPFCSMAFADSRIEHDLKLDGIRESLIYVAGVGTRPSGGWRPLSDRQSSGRDPR